MEFLHLLEGLRTPLFDTLFSLVTRLGEETLFMVLGMVFFWCIDKKKGYFLLYVGFLGTILNQFLKMLFCIPRPWVRDPGFTIVESARDAATGYSFPSGHTQCAGGLYGGIARFAKRGWVRALGIALVLLVGFSRMYLGVHTPADVGVSLLLSAVLVLALWPAFERGWDRPAPMRALLAALTGAAVLLVLYAELVPFPANAIMEYSENGVKTAWQMLGVVLGMLLTRFVDDRYTHFTTEAPLGAQFLKVVLGLALVMAIRLLLKTPLTALTGGHASAHGLRYFLMTAFGGAVWPLTFPLLCRIGTKLGNKKRAESLPPSSHLS